MGHDLLAALALLLVVEGIFPFLNPQGLKRTLMLMSAMDDKSLRFTGLSSMVLGVILLYIIN